jgi:hypothetical protein
MPIDYGLQSDTENAELGIFVFNCQDISRLPRHYTRIKFGPYSPEGRGG